MISVKFKSLSSGSCGNCYFLALYDDSECLEAVLIDAGVSPRRLKRELAAEGIGLEVIRAMLITHDHCDHVRSLGSYCKHYSFPVYTTAELAAALSRHFSCKDYFPQRKATLSQDWNQISDRIEARYFIVPHDASQTVGYALRLSGYDFVIMTDIGAMTEEALSLAQSAGSLVIESNYDLDMLRHGPYPKILQDRICGGNGHLSNEECALALSSIVHSGLRNVFLCHLSEHNNTPTLAHRCSRAVLPPEVRLVALPRQSPSPLFNL